MRLRALEIQGFKSFPDKTRLEFGDGITAVVGPNGSGKSNIADAVRWVLGEQSTKNLRGAKMEDVIFGGTQTRKAQGFAMVQLTIDNSDRALDHDADELTITRRLYRSGDSEYRLGGTMVRLKDIHQLFMDTGLGRDGYSIIGQGKIAEIVSAKSRERREIFEEAAGIAKYRYRKEEAEKKLAGAEENLIRLRDILAELEGRVGPLQVQSEKAKEFLQYSGEKRSLEITLWFLDLAALKEKLKSQQDKIFISKNDYEQIELEAGKFEEQINAVYAQMQQLGMQADESRAQVRSLEERTAKSESEKAVLENDIHHNTVSIRRLQQELEGAGEDAQEIQARLSGKEKELAEARENLNWMAGKIQAAEERLEEQREQSAKVEEELARLGQRRATLSGALSEHQLTRASNETLRGESQNRISALEQAEAARNHAVQEASEALEECREQLREEEEKAASLENSLKGYTMKLDSRKDKLEALKKRRQELENEMSRRLQRAKLLEDLERSMEGFAHSVKFIMGESSKGSLGGVFGPVSSLVRVPSEYALAIETALGGAMQNIVVKDEDTAKQAIRLLKSKNAGRATFLPVSAVKGKRLDAGAVKGQEGYVGIAADLVKAEERFGGILNQLLGRVCVVEDLDAGTRIAKSTGYSFRIVTLDGQVINAGGSYTGGSTGKSTGVLGRRNEIEQLTGEAEKLKKEVAALEDSLKSAQEELAGLDAYVAGAQAELRTAQEEVVRLGYLGQQLERSLAQAKENRALAQKELEELPGRMSRLQDSDDAQFKMMQELEASITQVDEEHQAASARRDSLSEGVSNAVETLNDLRMTQLSAQKDRDILEAEIVQIRQQIEGYGDRSRQLKEEMAKLEDTNRSLEQRIQMLQTERGQLTENIQALNAGIEEIGKKRNELEASTAQLRQQERELSNRREGVSRELARLEERKNAIQSEYDGIIAKLWDEYELTKSQAAQEAVDIDDRPRAERRLSELRSKIKALGTVNVAAIEEYAQVSERYEFLSGQVADVEESKKQLSEMILQLTQEMRDIFADNFSKIAEHFSRIFVQLFGGGRGELTLTQNEDVLEAGVDINVQPPGKVIKNLTLLSGGEQAFVAIAIYFAILKVRPAPFCLLDEIEAALDDVNVVKFANYLRTMSKNTQFIAITHRRGTMEEADVLYGVTMQDEGVSKLLELKVSEVESKLGIS